jgi:hypothetical protein
LVTKRNSSIWPLANPDSLVVLRSDGGNLVAGIEIGKAIRLKGFNTLVPDNVRCGGGWSAKDYLIKRVARLYPLAFAGMLIGFPAFYWGGEPDGGARAYSVLDMAEMLGCNLFFIPYFGSNGSGKLHIFSIDGPLWSIFFEMFASAPLFGWFTRVPAAWRGSQPLLI